MKLATGYIYSANQLAERREAKERTIANNPTTSSAKASGALPAFVEEIIREATAYFHESSSSTEGNPTWREILRLQLSLEREARDGLTRDWALEVRQQLLQKYLEEHFAPFKESCCATAAMVSPTEQPAFSGVVFQWYQSGIDLRSASLFEWSARSDRLVKYERPVSEIRTMWKNAFTSSFNLSVVMEVEQPAEVKDYRSTSALDVASALTAFFAWKPGNNAKKLTSSRSSTVSRLSALSSSRAASVRDPVPATDGEEAEVRAKIDLSIFC